jgi:hypothetical protein
MDINSGRDSITEPRETWDFSNKGRFSKLKTEKQAESRIKLYRIGE